MRHTVRLHTGIAAGIDRMLQAYRHAVYLNRHAVGDKIIVLVMIQLFIELERIRKGVPHRGARRMVPVLADKQVNVAPSTVMGVGIKCRQPGSFHQHRLYAGFRHSLPCHLQGMLQMNLLLHHLHAHAFHLHTRSGRHRLLPYHIRKNECTCSLQGVQPQQDVRMFGRPSCRCSPQGGSYQREVCLDDRGHAEWVLRVRIERMVKKKYLMSVRTGCARYSVRYLSSLANSSSNVLGWSI